VFTNNRNAILQKQGRESMSMKLCTRRNVSLFATVALTALMSAGCASTNVVGRQQMVTGQLARPAHIWVYDFVATPADLPVDSPLAGETDLDTKPQTAEQIAEGKQLGSAIALQLAEQIREMGMPGLQAPPGAVPQINDIVIRGYLLSIEQGSAAKRVAIGFGAGASELRTLVEGFQVTAQGPRKLGSATVEAGGSKSPGAALGVVGFLATANPVGLIVSGGMKVYGEASGSSKVEGRAKSTAKEIADVLKKRFQEQGWID
jgi:hypothetical protein